MKSEIEHSILIVLKAYFNLAPADFAKALSGGLGSRHDPL